MQISWVLLQKGGMAVMMIVQRVCTEAEKMDANHTDFSVFCPPLVTEHTEVCKTSGSNIRQDEGRQCHCTRHRAG